MKIVAISDTHGQHGFVGKGRNKKRFAGVEGGIPDLPDGDVLIHAGDFTGHGHLWQAAEFAKWMQKFPHTFKIAIAGNHDRCAEEYPNDVSRIFGSHGIYYLWDSDVVIEGVKFYGTPYVPQFFDWSFMEEESDLVDRYAKIPLDTDVLITHGPPLGICDKNKYLDRTGSPALLDRVDVVKPKVHVFGHIHEGRDPKYTEDGWVAGYCSNGKTDFYNVSFLDGAYLPYGIPQPVVEVA